MEIKGVIFDMDGLLLDTEKLYTRFWREAAAENGCNMTAEHALSIRSLGRRETTAKLTAIFGELFKYKPVHDRRVELMEKYIKENGVELKKGARELLEYLKKSGRKIALATSSNYERSREQLGSVGVFEYFDACACGPMVEHSKPEPDIYLLAAKKLGLAPQSCMALEDSPTGIKAAFAAGCKAVMVPDLDKPDENTRKLLFACCDDLGQVIDLIRENEKEALPAQNK